EAAERSGWHGGAGVPQEFQQVCQSGANVLDDTGPASRPARQADTGYVQGVEGSMMIRQQHDFDPLYSDVPWEQFHDDNGHLIGELYRPLGRADHDQVYRV